MASGTIAFDRAIKPRHKCSSYFCQIPKCRAGDLNGAGAAKSPGRWNDDGQHVLYTAPTIAIAVLETAAHVDDSGLPVNRYLVRIEIPDSVWAARVVMDVSKLPMTWAAIPAGRVSVQAGAHQLRSMAPAILEVPSVIVPEEAAALINPLHPDAKRLAAKIVRPFAYNRLFRGA
jgi:RES domain-containing protein